MSPSAQLYTKSAILDGGAHVEKSVSGIDSLLAGVSIIYGNIVITVDDYGISVLSAI